VRQEIYEFLQSREDLQKFIREQPIWYRRLTRNPTDLEAFELAMLHHYKKTIPDRVEKFQNQVQMASLMIDVFQVMRQGQ
jgi:YlbE-like protein